MKKLKKAILFNVGRFQEDFEYIFSDIEIEKYITEENIDTYNGKEAIRIDNLNKSNKTIIIICDRKNEKYDKLLNNIGYIENKNYIYMEDYSVVLNEKESSKLDFIKEKLYYWGCHQRISNSEMFKEMIYTDPRYDFDCYMPFEYAQVQTFGYTYPCCEGWAKYNIGNIFFDRPKKVWNSAAAKLYRLSVINKTFAFCNPDNCPYLNNPQKVEKRYTNQHQTEIPTITCLAFDYTCNLMCKSCRKNRINNNKDENYKLMHDNIVKKLQEDKWLESHELLVASQGEALMGEAYKKILFSKKSNRTSITLHTNATLLNKKNLDKLIEKYNDITMYISVDAATKDTYEKLRVGGNFDVLTNNLKLISEAKKEGKIRYVSILYVLQRENYKELADTCRMVIDLGFDRFDVTRIFNWGTYSDEEFETVSMYDENGMPKSELVEVLKDPIFKTDKITIMGNVFK